MATIEKSQKVMTLVNIFTVAPEKQAELAKLLIEATKETMRHLPGFVSASIHRSLDGTKVINYAQWRSQADFVAMKRTSEGGGGRIVLGAARTMLVYRALRGPAGARSGALGAAYIQGRGCTQVKGSAMCMWPAHRSQIARACSDQRAR